MSSEDHRRALLHLANAVNHLADALDRVKPECLKPGGTLLGGSFESDLAIVRQSLAKMLNEIREGGGHE